MKRQTRRFDGAYCSRVVNVYVMRPGKQNRFRFACGRETIVFRLRRPL